MRKKLTFDEITERISSLLSDDIELLKFLEAASELSKVYEINEEEEKRRLSEAKSFIEVAENDFKSAKILYESKVYSTAIYHLQQAVEKFIKAYMLMFFGLSKKVVKDYVGHDSPKAFLKLLEKFKISLNLISALTERVYELNSQMLKISSQDIRKLENIVNKNRKQIAEMSSEEIRNAIKLTVRLKEVLENKETKDEVSKFLATLKRELGKIEASDEYERNIASKITTLLNKILENLELSFKMYSNFLVLYTLSIITYPHATFARYPNERLPIEKYDENLGIIQCFGEITDLLEGVINSWKESPRYRGRY